MVSLPVCSEFAELSVCLAAVFLHPMTLQMEQ